MTLIVTFVLKMRAITASLTFSISRRYITAGRLTQTSQSSYDHKPLSRSCLYLNWLTLLPEVGIRTKTGSASPRVTYLGAPSRLSARK
jgi:hypothetical protein